MPNDDDQFAAGVLALAITLVALIYAYAFITG